MTEYDCPECDESFSNSDLEGDVSVFGDSFECPHCGAALRFEYELSYDGEGDHISSWVVHDE